MSVVSPEEERGVGTRVSLLNELGPELTTSSPRAVLRRGDSLSIVASASVAPVRTAPGQDRRRWIDSVGLGGVDPVRVLSPEEERGGGARVSLLNENGWGMAESSPSATLGRGDGVSATAGLYCDMVVDILSQLAFCVKDHGKAVVDSHSTDAANLSLQARIRKEGRAWITQVQAYIPLDGGGIGPHAQQKILVSHLGTSQTN